MTGRCGGLKDIFGKEISRDLIGRLHARNLIVTGPRSPRLGAPYTFVTTGKFLVAFDLESLLDLSRFDAAPLIAFTATKETNYGTWKNRRIP